MKVDPLPPIPSPPAHVWRQFRVRALPVVAFVVVSCLAVWLWSKNLANPLVMGTAQGLEADVSCPVDGTLSELRVLRFQEVREGDILALVNPARPEVLSNKLAVLRARMDVVRAEGGLDGGDKIRYAQLHLDWMQERTDLAEFKAQLAWAEREFERVTKLVEDKIVDPSQYDIARRDAEQARQSVELKTATVEDTEAALRRLDPTTSAEDSPAVVAALNVLEQELRLAEATLEPIPIVSPIDGRVSEIRQLPGTTVTGGNPIIKVASPEVQYILGYVGQPLRVEPTLGMKVEVRSRGIHRMVGEAQITHVGPRIELFDAPLRVRGMGNAQERGLPIVVPVPPEMKLNLRPGELVDLTLVL